MKQCYNRQSTVVLKIGLFLRLVTGQVGYSQGCVRALKHLGVSVHCRWCTAERRGAGGLLHKHDCATVHSLKSDTNPLFL